MNRASARLRRSLCGLCGRMNVIRFFAGTKKKRVVPFGDGPCTTRCFALAQEGGAIVVTDVAGRNYQDRELTLLDLVKQCRPTLS